MKPTLHDDPGDPPFINAQYRQKKTEYLTFCYILCTSVTENVQYLLFFSPRPSWNRILLSPAASLEDFCLVWRHRIWRTRRLYFMTEEEGTCPPGLLCSCLILHQLHLVLAKYFIISLVKITNTPFEGQIQINHTAEQVQFFYKWLCECSKYVYCTMVKKKDGALQLLLTDIVSEFKSVCLLLARFVWSKNNLGGGIILWIPVGHPLLTSAA